MPRLNVRCCCQSEKILGTLEVASLDRKHQQVMHKNLRSVFFDFDPRSTTEITKSVNYEVIELRDFVNDNGYTEIAVYSEDRPIEFWRKLHGFIEAK